ncbi:MAG: hypothetical protein ABIJ21_00675 [Nanoarchaeota archaeon]
MYDMKEDVPQPVREADSVLERIAGAYTKMDEVENEQYGVDNCYCGSCWCFKDDYRLILSPVGISTKVIAYGPFTATGMKGI